MSRRRRRSNMNHGDGSSLWRSRVMRMVEGIAVVTWRRSFRVVIFVKHSLDDDDGVVAAMVVPSMRHSKRTS